MNTHTGLVLNLPEEDHWVMGSGKARARFGGTLNPTGDWTPFLPPFEAQSRDGFDPQSCALEHTIRAYITLARYLNLKDFLPNGSERYTGVWAGTTANGTDPHAVAETIRTFAGLVPQEVMPWTDEMTFDSYYNRAQAAGVLSLGQALLDLFEFGSEWVFPFGTTISPEQKAAKLQEALTRGPVCVSISGDYRYDNGRLFKNAGDPDTHWTLYAKKDTICDSYEPEMKTLVPNYDHQAAKVYFLQRKVNTKQTFWDTIWRNFSQFVWNVKV